MPSKVTPDIAKHLIEHELIGLNKKVRDIVLREMSKIEILGGGSGGGG